MESFFSKLRESMMKGDRINIILAAITVTLFWTSNVLGLSIHCTKDDFDRIIQVKESDESLFNIVYSYDSIGNRLSITSQGPTLPPLEASDTGFFSLDNTTLQITVTTYDEKYGDLTYEVAIGTSPGQTDVLDWTEAEIGPNGNVTLGGLNLPLNQKYFVSVRVRNFAGDIVTNEASTDGVIVLDSQEDPDGDGFDNETEVSVMSNPLDPNSFPAETTITLYPGMNLVAIPAEVAYVPYLSSWVSGLGDPSEIDQILYLDKDTGKFVVFKPGQTPPQDVILQGGDALVVYSRVEKTVTFHTILCAEPELVPGFNLVGFSCPPENYTAYDLLEDYGSDTVTSIRRFSPQKGAYEAAGFDENENIIGINFPIVRGEGYIVFVKP
ncbi:MAG: hypothetical protein DRH12_07780 [Deltaproteobacteria bacterium]|nr:MAG: hypothetical protein DRH12_07780 [Deltaproteobacteria bacterium]